MYRSLLLSVLLSLFTPAIAQSTCLTALDIGPGMHVVAAVAGNQVPYPLCAQTSGAGTAGQWYRYTAALDTTVTITTQTSGVDTRVHVYVGSCSNLLCLTGDDDSGLGNTSTVTFAVNGGSTYFIAFDNRWTSAGFNFELSEVPALVNDQVVFTSQPITGWNQGQPSGTVDMNGDHLDDIVVPGTTSLFIAHQTVGGFSSFTFPHPSTAHGMAISLAVGDLDANGYNDMLYGGGSGVSFMMANNDGTAYTEAAFPEFVFCQRTNMVDINNDGNLDAFSCHDIGENVHYINDGSGSLTFNQGSFGGTSGNYGSIWIDHDNDGDLDLYLTKCGSDPTDQLFQNDGSSNYADVAPGLGFAVVHQAWSSAWGDYDNDGDMDVMVGESGGTDHRLFRNDLGSYTNVSIGSGFVNTNGSIEWRTHDFNNDGWLDVLSSFNIYYNNGDLTFTPVPNGNLTGAVGDLNNDGFLDVMVPPNSLWINGGNDNNWITIALQGTLSNSNGIGARVRIVSALGQQVRDIVSGDGFRFMSTLNAHFGIGDDTAIDFVEVHWPSGIVDVVPAPPINGTLVVEEGLSTGLVNPPCAPAFAVFPNPAQDRITVTGETSGLSSFAVVFDLAGKPVLSGRLSNGQLAVSALRPGSYALLLGSGARLRFIKR